jgi:uncharacterized protein (TIGR02996 family)
MTDKNQRHTFLQAIIANPVDDAPRRAYADWLERHGDPERAEFIRVQCDLGRLSLDDLLDGRQLDGFEKFAPRMMQLLRGETGGDGSRRKWVVARREDATARGSSTGCG